MRHKTEQLNFQNNPEVRRAFQAPELGLLVQALAETIRQNDPWQVYLLSRGHKADRMQSLLQAAGFAEVYKDMPEWDEDAVAPENRPNEATAIAALKSSGKSRGERTVSVSNDVMVYHEDTSLFKPKGLSGNMWQDHFVPLLGGQGQHNYRVHSSIATAPPIQQGMGIVTESVHNVVLEPLSRRDRANYIKSIPNKMRAKSNGGIFWESPIIGEHIQKIDDISYTHPDFEATKARFLRALLGFPDCVFGVLHAIVENKIPAFDLAEIQEIHSPETVYPFLKLEAENGQKSRVPYEKAGLLYTYPRLNRAQLAELPASYTR